MATGWLNAAGTRSGPVFAAARLPPAEDIPQPCLSPQRPPAAAAPPPTLPQAVPTLRGRRRPPRRSSGAARPCREQRGERRPRRSGQRAGPNTWPRRARGSAGPEGTASVCRHGQRQGRWRDAAPRREGEKEKGRDRGVEVCSRVEERDRERKRDSESRSGDRENEIGARKGGRGGEEAEESKRRQRSLGIGK